jgi:hypothetical protein
MRPAVFLLCMACGLMRPDRIESADFPETYGSLVCDRVKECNLGAFKQEFHNMADCQATQVVTLKTLMVAYEELGCDYTPDGAGDALTSLAKMTCGAFFEQAFLDDYETIWNGCIQGDTGG